MESISYIFVVKTNKYTGNFERDLCGYTTGIVGDCEVGSDKAEEFKEELGDDIFHRFEQIIGQRADDHGCYRPCQVRQTPKDAPNHVVETYGSGGKIYETVCHNDMDIYFNEQPDKDLVDIMKQRAYDFGKQRKIEIVGFELLQEKVTTEYITIEI